MDKYIIRKSFKDWSSGTVVELVESLDAYAAQVRHVSTNQEFEIPWDYLIEKRDRSHRDTFAVSD
jgi:hypothetical protein